MGIQIFHIPIHIERFDLVFNSLADTHLNPHLFP